MKLVVMVPKSPMEQMELQKELARFHANHVIKMAAQLSCPTEQKLELTQALIHADDRSPQA